MASQCQAGLVLLASLILLLFWTTISALSYDDTPDVPLQHNRVQRDLPARPRNQVQSSTEVVKESLTAIKVVIDDIPVKKVTDVMKSFSKMASLSPGIGTLVACVLDIVLAFVPQDDPVLIEVKKGFAEVNRKLDSLSFQISNLATDVEWFNYASVYSRDEVTILNAWDKFNDLRQNSNLVQSAEDRLRLAEIFTSSYENSGAESSVSNLYRYLTVNSTSLSANLNNLLKKKFKCDITKIGKYNLYFSSLLWKGMVLNQFYWRLIGFNTTTKEDEHVQMFKKVSEAQLAAIDYCLQNYEDYMKKDVVETVKGLSTDDKQAIALKVKEVLDQKYNWYNWVVVVYNKANKNNHIVFDATEIDAGDTIVLVSYYFDIGIKYATPYKETAEKCFNNEYCQNISIDQCHKEGWGSVDLIGADMLKYNGMITHVTYDEDFAEVPAPVYRVGCYWFPAGGLVSIRFKDRIHFCRLYLCQNNAKCKRILDSNEWFCQCPTGFKGEYCEHRIDTRTAPKKDAIFPHIKLMQDRIQNLENNVEKIMNRCHIS
ncbi:SE-cephalotoxin-like isoform X2 [Girardinichthys multiradiatus]|nr:SE-cephalotoxin-like isoform X2 [Girardinichthys multiradiatus]XP_047214618.1 SE-cephalotoxin-like isoform X2 [Girardinichthys multiradiatus]